MSVIAVKNVHFKTSLPQIVKVLAKYIRGHFEAINFHSPKKNPACAKICYIRLSEWLDPHQVVARINALSKYQATIPSRVPDLPPANRKNAQIKNRQKRLLNIPEDVTMPQALAQTIVELLTEMQNKYTGLWRYSNNTGHKLLDQLAQTILDRFKAIVVTDPSRSGYRQTGFQLSLAYRKLHPHFGDFQLILSTLHKIQDAAGQPRMQLSENELIVNKKKPFVLDQIPLSKMNKVTNVCAERVVKKVSEYMKTLKSRDAEAPEDEAQQKVRQQLFKLEPYLPIIIKQVISETFVPPKSPFTKVRIYGEPYLPAKEQMAPFLRPFRAVKVMRSQRMFNILMLGVPPQLAANLFEMDGTTVGGAKLVIRPSNLDKNFNYKLKPEYLAQINALYGVEGALSVAAERDNGEECWGDEYDDGGDGMDM